MIEVQNVPRVTYHRAFQFGIAADSEDVALIITEGEHSHVYTMSKGEAEKVEKGIAKARTGLHIATAVPNGDGRAA